MSIQGSLRDSNLFAMILLRQVYFLALAIKYRMVFIIQLVQDHLTDNTFLDVSPLIGTSWKLFFPPA
jgi:hypothetical protein